MGSGEEFAQVRPVSQPFAERATVLVAPSARAARYEELGEYRVGCVGAERPDRRPPSWGTSGTNVTFVPAMIQALLVMVPDLAERQFPRLDSIAYVASPIAAETLRAAIAAVGCKFAQVFEDRRR
jgi:hypothetical protein